MKNSKKVTDSYTHHVQILSQSSLNGYRRLFGGRLMEWIDIVAAVVARRHCNMNVTTAAVDSLIFKKPAFANDTVVIDGYITYAGKTSMEICVETFVENLDGSKEAINTAYVVMVAIDQNGKPSKVPELIIETEQDRQNYEAALRRKEYRKLRANEKF
ncbi:MAG: acyl-CoA thioesterase [Clostridia bacterium]|nr:acyl-CoA thioesterase [Clostridia bacterium]